MTFHEKISRLLVNMNRSAVSRASGVKLPTLQNYLVKRSLPNIDNAAKLARTLGVDPGWLIDDTRGWPPARTAASDCEPVGNHAA